MEDHPHPAVTHRRAISPAKTLLEFDCKNRRGVTARLGIVDADPRSAGDGDGLGATSSRRADSCQPSSPRNPEAASLPRPAANASRSSHSSAQASRASSLTSGQGSPNTRWARARRRRKDSPFFVRLATSSPQTSLLPAPRGEPVPDLGGPGSTTTRSHRGATPACPVLSRHPKSPVCRSSASPHRTPTQPTPRAGQRPG